MRFGDGRWALGRATVVDRLVNRRSGAVLFVLDVEPGAEGVGYRATTKLVVGASERALPVVGEEVAVECCVARRAVRFPAPAPAFHRVLAGFPEWPLVLG
jgi:hypothetical protein